jgi:hypothetical protein
MELDELLPNHRVELRAYVDTMISIVLTKKFETDQGQVTLYFGVAGYKNEIMIGTDIQYEKGGMYELRYQGDLWYNLLVPEMYQSSNHVLLYTEIDEARNLIGYFGKDLPIFKSQFDESIKPQVILTPVEIKLLVNELKKDKEIYMEYFKNEKE